MVERRKDMSPFYPGRPVPVELFVGRSDILERLITRGIKQVASGKPCAVFVEGEYGIGKSSIVNLLQRMAERRYGLHGIYASLGGATDLTGLGESVLAATARSGAFEEGRAEHMRRWLAKYIEKAELFGVTVNTAAIRHDAPELTSPLKLLDFLQETMSRLLASGVKGIFLALDELNGIASNPQFSFFLKSLVDQNAMSARPIPLLLVLCGVAERRRAMTEKHPPAARLFDIVEVGAMTESEVSEFFIRALSTVEMKATDAALNWMVHFSAGFPAIMHLIGDEAYWFDDDGTIDLDDATVAVLRAAEQLGQKYVEGTVYKALRTNEYRSILNKIGRLGVSPMSFTKAQIADELTDAERQRWNNFLQTMKRLQVIRPGESRGEWRFNSRIVRLYVYMRSAKFTAISKGQ